MHNSGLPGVVPNPSPYSTVVMTEQLVIEHLKQCRDLTRGFAYRVFPGFWRQWCKQVLEIAEQAKSSKDQVALYETQNLLVAVQQAAEQEFCQHLANGYVKFKNKTLNTPTGEERSSGDIISLVVPSDEEETNAITSIIHRADNFFAEQLWSSQQRLALLNEGEKIEERSNPASPIQFCEALRKVLTNLDIDVKTKLIGYKFFDQEVIGQLDTLYVELNDYLIRQNLLPYLRFVADADNTPAKINEESVDDDSFERTAVAAQTSQSTGDKDFLQILGVLDQIQNQSLAQTKVALGRANPGNSPLPTQPVADVSRQVIQQIAIENEKGAVESGDMQTIDLVGMLFQYMLSDNHLPDSIKALLSYLHIPFLKTAFIEKGFFEQPEHPARLLLNSLAEAGVRWVSNDGSDQYDIYNKIKTTVFHLLHSFKNDVRIFAESLLEFNAYTHNVARRQGLMERRALEKAQSEEKLREAKIQVNNEVRKRTDDRDIPSAILLLLLQPWSDFLSFIVLRYGEKSESWARALKIIDDLLWTLEPKTLQADKARQKELQEQVLSALERGFETIGYEQAKGLKLLEAVVSLQRMALLSRKAEPAPAPMRNKLESMAAEKAGYVLTGAQVLTQEETSIVDSLKMVDFGTWFEFEGGRRLKVVWYNKKTQHYMLVDQLGRKVSLLADLELARDIVAGKAKIIAGGTKPFFERALENIYHTLNGRADALKAGKSQ